MHSMLTTLALSLATLATPAGGAEVLASYRGGTVTRAEYESWLLGQGQEDAPAMRASTLEAIALSESLVDAAVAAGIDRQPRNAFRLAQIETVSWRRRSARRPIARSRSRTSRWRPC